MELLSRKQAKEQTSVFYFTGIPCPHGHVSKRYTTTSNCFDCHTSYYGKPDQKLKQKEYRERTKDKKAAYDAEFSKNNAAYRNALKSANRAKRKQRIVGWDKEFTEFVAVEAFSLARIRHTMTGIVWHVDHVIPLRGKAVSGLHVPNNIQVVPATWNLRKSNVLIERFFG